MEQQLEQRIIFELLAPEAKHFRSIGSNQIIVFLLLKLISKGSPIHRITPPFED